jgi:type IV pilus assembly protein PilF
MNMSKTWGVWMWMAMLLGGCGQAPTKPDPESAEQRPAEIYVQLSVAYLQEGNYETALAKAQKAFELDPNYPPAHNALGLICNQMGNNGKAEEHFKRAITLDPNEGGALNNYGQLLCQLNRPEEAAAMFDRSIASPDYGTPEIAHANAGVCALQNKDTAKAESHFRAALEREPNLPTALIEMADLSYQKGDPLVARNFLQHYLDTSGPSSRSLWLGVRIERKLGNREAASKYAQTLSSGYPRSPEARQLLESGE